MTRPRTREVVLFRKHPFRTARRTLPYCSALLFRDGGLIKAEAEALFKKLRREAKR